MTRESIAYVPLVGRNVSLPFDRGKHKTGNVTQGASGVIRPFPTETNNKINNSKQIQPQSSEGLGENMINREELLTSDNYNNKNKLNNEPSISAFLSNSEPGDGNFCREELIQAVTKTNWDNNEVTVITTVDKTWSVSSPRRTKVVR